MSTDTTRASTRVGGADPDGTACVLCGGDVTTYTALKAYRVLRCRDCGIHFLHPLPFDDPSDVYETFYETDGVGWWQWDEGSAAQFNWIVEQVQRRVPSGRVFDIGCGGGFFLEICRTRGYEVGGCELSRSGALRASELLGIPVPQQPFEELDIAAGSLDVVSLNNVLEHLPTPRRTLEAVHRALRPGGLLTVSVPNLVFGKIVRTAFKPLEWMGLPNPAYRVSVFHVPGHVFFFSPRTLTALLEQCGFADVQLYNEVPVRNRGVALKNLTKTLEYQAARALHVATGRRLLLGHGLTCFARKPEHAAPLPEI